MVPENGIHSGGLNPGPLGYESSALITRPRLLALNKMINLGNGGVDSNLDRDIYQNKMWTFVSKVEK
jgi:hypothetical protein